MSGYIVGIDLGTTNSVVTFFSTEGDAEPELQTLKIAQYVDLGQVEEKGQLPSFLYQPLEDERSELCLSWQNETPTWVSGVYARSRGSEVPGRFVSSAKSWLCQKNRDKRSEFLPFESDESVSQISPYQATVAFLRHISEAWQNQIGSSLGHEDIVLTVPASFDEEARQLTEAAAREVGFNQLTLLEEPLAALYAWVQQQHQSWREVLQDGDVILVCDVGGGTTDFSTVEVYDDEGKLGLKRTAVGDHILLGGDNMDLALAYQAKQRFKDKGKKMNSMQMRSLWFGARQLKEDLLSGAMESKALTVLGTGSRLIGGTLKADFNRDEVTSFLLSGFFPECSLEDLPEEPKRSGLQEMGLPFAADAGITRHLARFLNRQRENESFKWPTHLLFNGGVFQCPEMRTRVSEVVNTWLESQQQKPLADFAYVSLNDAVSQGAAYFAWAKQGRGIRIKAGTSRSYYIEVESAMPAVPGMEAPSRALCVVPFGLEEGSSCTLDGETFALRIGEPAKFQFLSSPVRQEDEAGEAIEDWDDDEMDAAHVMEVNLPSEQDLPNPVPVQLAAHVNDVGTLELSFQHTDSDRHWKLEYSVREGD